MGRVTRKRASTFSGPHWHGRAGSAAIARTPLALALGVLAFLEFGNANGPVERVVGTLGFSDVGAALLVGIAGAALGWLGQRGPDRHGMSTHPAVGRKQAEAPFESFWNDTPEGLFSVDADEAGRFKFSGINPALERMTGLREIDLIGRAPEECLRPEVAASVSARYRECIQLGQPITFDETLDLPTGVRHWRTSLVPIRAAAGERVALILASARDITADRTAHDDLSRLNEHLRSVLSSISDCYCSIDNKWRLTFANEAALRWAGKTSADVIGKCYRAVYAPDTPTGRVVTEAMERRRVVREDLPSATRPGRWLKYNIYPTSDGGLALFFRDVTDIRKAREALSNLPRQMLALQENERCRIASELHDSTIQHIVAASLNLMRLGPQASDADRTACDEIQRSLDEALQELRVFTYLLHPPALSRDGLVATLRTFLDGFGRRAGLDVSVRVCPALDTLSNDLQHAIFRVVQEALSNTHRHAHATQVDVRARLIRARSASA